ncbi:MAG: hypothetical protein J0L93_05185 [Deltaproteobacteria bacterium]|nr:hypothetical protein [Deltaproteobacteria bacterium]
MFKKAEIILCFSLCFLISNSEIFARGGDAIRSNAPTIALVLDARAGNEGPLLDAYFDDQIDYFLDMEPATNAITRDLYNLRGAGQAIESGDYSTADQRIRSLPRFENEKIYLKGVLDAALGKYEASLENFRQLIDNRKKLSPHLASLAFMGAARIFHEVGDYKQAIYHYNQVGPLDSEIFEAIFEKSWSFYLDGDMNGALGATLAATSPFYDNEFFPEAFVVRAAAFFQTCYFERASLTVEKFKKDYSNLLNQFQELQRRGPASWLFDDRILNSMNPKVRGALIANNAFRSTMRAYLKAKDEATRLRGADAALATQVLNFLKGRLVEQASFVISKAERVLQNQLAEADKIQLEILQAGVNKLMGLPPEQNMKMHTMNLSSVDFDGRVQFYPFKGEFWLDELPSYYYGLKSNCENTEGS